MIVKRGKAAPRCWGPKLWWLGLVLGIVIAYFVLYGREISYWPFMLILIGTAAAGATGTKFLGTWIDRNYRTEKGLLKQELKLCRALLKWLKRIHRKHADHLEAAVLQRKLAGGIEKLEELIKAKPPEMEALIEERRRMEQFVEDHLTRFRKSATREYIESIGVAVLIALALRAFVLEAFQIPSGSMIPSLRVGDHIFVSKMAYGVRVPMLPLHIGGMRIPAVSLNWSMPEPGDVIVFVTPENEVEDYIKRVIAVAGDTVEVREQMVYINGEPYTIEDAGRFNYDHLDEDGEFDYRAFSRRFIELIPGASHPILRKTCSDNQDCALRFGTNCNLKKGVCEQTHFGPYKVPEGHVFCMGDNRDDSRDSRFWGSVPMEFIKGKAEFIWWSYREGLVRWERMFTRIR